MGIFFSDLKRAFISPAFASAFLIHAAVLIKEGQGELYVCLVPLLCTLPYSTAWLDEYKSGSFRMTLVRTGLVRYSLSKFLSCVLSGGAAEALAAVAASLFGVPLPGAAVFFSGALWAAVSAVMSALCDSKYIAYGSPFVFFWFIVIVRERFSSALPDPASWISPSPDVAAYLASATAALGVVYVFILIRRIRRA